MMGPKRKAPPATASVTTTQSKTNSKRRRTSYNSNQPQIDYDLLAEAILRKQNTATAADDVAYIVDHETQQNEQSEIPTCSTTVSPTISQPVSLYEHTADHHDTTTSVNSNSDFTSFLSELFSGELGANTTNVHANPP